MSPVPAETTSQLLTDFESVDSPVFALLGLLSLSERSQRAWDRPASSADVAESATENDDLLDILLGVAALSGQVLSSADAVLPPDNEVATRHATTDEGEAAQPLHRPVGPAESLLR